MKIINRTNLSDWTSYLNENVIASSTKNLTIEVPNGPHNTLDDAMADAGDLIAVYDHELNSDLHNVVQRNFGDRPIIIVF